ncbi:phosphoglycerate kinase [Candidatus Endomicrobiellum trichonymphae]|uniref:Phosphoglycerate kinase n=1 Tax=Endomicrobium trichonymphae TaxID=1408204 RepID=B1GZE7_ENDTX|nr:phosphoglycerate kinase [Candidatus Endomicrobium trichonymphae]BAG13629.1 phosphoglycerate kinase [Candidatus Endomicrobium trichonymphae]
MKNTLKDIDVKGKKVLVRVDYNVPLDANLKITNDKRIAATIPTIQYLLEKNSAIILMAHLGRPKGKIVPGMSLKPVPPRLSEFLGKPVKFVGGDCIDSQSKKAAADLKPGEILLLENLRFHPEEEGKNASGEKDKAAMDVFAKELASMGEVFVQDAFGTVHRAHASTTAIVKYAKDVVAGFLVEKELKFLGEALENPVRPFLAILGGAKVSDKINVIKNLLNKADTIIIGGAMAYTFLKSQEVITGTSLVEDDKLDLAIELIKKSKERKVALLLPIDHIITDKVDFVNKQMPGDAIVKNTADEAIPEGFMGVDIGLKSIEKFSKIIKSAKTIVWNGPLGIFEIDEFSKGTIKIANLVAKSTDNGAISIVGGGDSIAAVKKAGVDKRINHISTGGGASLEFLEDKELPGIAALPDKK